MLGTWLPARGKFATVSILPVNEPQHLRDHVRTSQKPCVILLTTLNGWMIDGWIDGTQKHLVEWVCTIWFIVCLSSWSWPRTVKKEVVIFKSTMVIMQCYVMLWTALSFKRDREWKEAHKRGNATSLWLLRLILLKAVDPSDSCHPHNLWLVSSKRSSSWWTVRGASQDCSTLQYEVAGGAGRSYEPQT